jgi:DNA-binding SARP family transcriptional activator
MPLQLAASPRFIDAGGSGIALAPRDAALLAWLALEGPTLRTRLAQMLWPGSEPEAARNALRQRLFQLKKQLGVELVTGSATLRLAEGVIHDLHDSDSVLGDATQAFGAELDGWLAQQRSRRRARLGQSLIEFSELAERTGDHADALSHAHELLALEPLSEAAHRRVMRLHYVAGDRAAALIAFDRCEQALKNEIGTQPSPETLALLASIEHSTTGAAAEGSAAVSHLRVPASVSRPPRLIGREVAWQALHEAWDDGHRAVVVGDGGMGKSRLIGDFARARGRTLVASARPGDEHVVYAAFSRLLREVPGQTLRALDAPLRSELARLLPELGDVPAPRGQEDQVRFFNAVSAALDSDSLALDGIVFDDLHFADDASIELLRYVIAASKRHWLVAARPAELREGGRSLLDELLTQPDVVCVPLEPLTLAQVIDLVDSLGIDTLRGASAAEALLRHSGGNPLYLLETVKAWFARDHGGAEVPLPARLPVARSLHQLIERRIGQLSQAAVQLARCAAVAAPDFSIELASHVLGKRTLDLADPWAELEAAQVLREGAFAHDLIYESALASVPAPVARQLHAEIAEFLGQHGGEQALLAGHWARARRWGPAGQAYLKAALRALDAGRSAEQCRLLSQAARCFEQAGDADARFDALLQRATVLVNHDLGGEAQTAVAELQCTARDDAQRLSALGAQLELAMMRSEIDVVLRLAPTAVQAARAQARPELELRFALAWSGALLDARRAAEGVAVLEPCQGWVDSHASLEDRWEYAMARSLALDCDGRLRDAARGWQLCQALARQASRPDLLWQSMANAAGGLGRIGHVRESCELFLQARQIALSTGRVGRLRLMQSEISLAHRLRDLGRYAEALPLFEELLAGFSTEGSASDIAMTQHRLALLFLFLGQPARAQPLLTGEAHGLPPGIAMFRRVMQGELAWHLAGDALTPMREALAALPDRDDVYHRTGSLFAARVVPADEGEAMAASLASWASMQERLGLAMGAHVRAATRAADQCAWARALVHVEAATALERDHQPDSFYLGELWWAAGRVYIGLGREEEARRALAHGRQWVTALASAHVPEPFRESFLHRNPVNRELLALHSMLR